MSKTRLYLIIVAALAVAAGTVTIGAANGVGMTPVTGAIFTTDFQGLTVNGNIYAQKEDVYISGGPRSHGQGNGPSLPAGDYYFQVTDPSGQKLLSLDSIGRRKFTVSADGVIVAAVHYTQHDLDSWNLYKGVVVQLDPFDDTPNPGGEYKVWVTPVECYKSEGAFLPRYSKTDNFKVEAESVRPQALIVRKFKDCNSNGAWDPGEQEISGWKVEITEPSGAKHEVTTPVHMPAYDGEWTVSEATPGDSCPDWGQTALVVDGKAETVAPSVTIRFSGSGSIAETHKVDFGNVSLSSITACKFYDCNANGEWDNCEPPVPGIKFVLTGPGSETRTLYTDAGGCVTFCGLYPGVYTLIEVLPTDTVACNWRPTTPTQIDNIIVTCDGAGAGSYLFGNVVIGIADFSADDSWHNTGLDDFNGCLDPGSPAYLRKQLSLELLRFVFNVWQHLGGKSMIETPDGTWVSTSKIIGEAVSAANSTEPPEVAEAAQQASRSLLRQFNGSSAVVYVLRHFSDCLPTTQY